MSSGSEPAPALAGKRILITGASSGIGRAAAIEASRLGAKVVLQGRDETRLAATAKGCVGESELACTSLDDFDAMVGWVRSIAAREPLGGIVHAAGVFRHAPLRLLSAEGLESMFRVNVFAALALLKAVASRGVVHDGAALVFLSSAAASVPGPALAAYSASKAALEAAARCAAMELRTRRIRVTCLAPAFVATPMLDIARASPGFDQAAERQWMGIADPGEIAAMICYLLSDVGRQVTGTTIAIDGGFSC